VVAEAKVEGTRRSEAEQAKLAAAVAKLREVSAPEIIVDAPAKE
jgi:hypothetical protein